MLTALADLTVLLHLGHHPGQGLLCSKIKLKLDSIKHPLDPTVSCFLVVCCHHLDSQSRRHTDLSLVDQLPMLVLPSIRPVTILALDLCPNSLKSGTLCIKCVPFPHYPRCAMGPASQLHTFPTGISTQLLSSQESRDHLLHQATWSGSPSKPWTLPSLAVCKHKHRRLIGRT